MRSRRWTPVVAVLLLLQVGAGASTAASLWQAPQRNVAESCRCVHGGAAQVCPMHKAPHAARCSLRSGTGDAAAVLGPMFVLLGVVPAAIEVPAPLQASLPAAKPAPGIQFLFESPDSPPPRG